MSEIDEETIARAMLHEEYGCAPEDVPNLYGKALATARLVMALVHPAIERARVEERERAAAVIDYRAERLRGNRKRIAQVDQHVLSIMESLAAAIRKG